MTDFHLSPALLAHQAHRALQVHQAHHHHQAAVQAHHHHQAGSFRINGP